MEYTKAAHLVGTTACAYTLPPFCCSDLAWQAGLPINGVLAGLGQANLHSEESSLVQARLIVSLTIQVL